MNGLEANRNPATTILPMKSGVRYATEVRVRKDSFTAFVNGRQSLDYKTDWQNVQVIEPAQVMASEGASAIVVPTNNALRSSTADLVAQSRDIDIACAMRNGVTVIRADVADRCGSFVSCGSSTIVDPDGSVLTSSAPQVEDLLITEIETAPRDNRQTWTPALGSTSLT